MIKPSHSDSNSITSGGKCYVVLSRITHDPIIVLIVRIAYLSGGIFCYTLNDLKTTQMLIQLLLQNEPLPDIAAYVHTKWV